MRARSSLKWTHSEKFLIDVCLKHFPKVFAQPFNAYDLLRQFFDGTVDVENGRQAMR